MKAPPEWHALDAQETIAADDLCRACRITLDELHEIVAYGVIVPVHRGEPPEFAADWLLPLREAARLRRAFDLDLFAAGLLAEHVRRIEQLEREVRVLQRQLGA